MSGRFLGQVARALGNLGRFVAHPFEVLRDFHRHRDEPEVGGERGLGQELDGQLVHLDLEPVDGPVLVPDAQGQVVVPGDQRLDRAPNGRFGIAGHPQQFLFQPRQFAYKVLA